MLRPLILRQVAQFQTLVLATLTLGTVGFMSSSPNQQWERQRNDATGNEGIPRRYVAGAATQWSNELEYNHPRAYLIVSKLIEVIIHSRREPDNV
jgi:hypothetical protein